LSYSSLSVKKQIFPSKNLYYSLDVIGSPFTTNVIPGAADYPYTIAYGKGLSSAITGTPAWFYIQSKDASGNNQSIDYEEIDPIDLISVQIVGGSDTANTIYYPNLEYLGAGLFKASYLPLNSGNFTVNIKMGLNDIQCGMGEIKKCSPFNLLITPGPTVPSISEAESPSFENMDYLVEAVAGSSVIFTFKLRMRMEITKLKEAMISRLLLRIIMTPLFYIEAT